MTTTFNDNLWDDLVRERGPALSQLEGPPPARAHRPRPRVIAGSSLALAGTGAALVIALGGGAAASPAFAVTRGPDGAVSVSVHRASGVNGADRALRRLGVRTPVQVNSQGQLSPCLAEGAAPPGGQTVVIPLSAGATPAAAVSGDVGPGEVSMYDTPSGVVFREGPAVGVMFHPAPCAIDPSANTGNTGAGD